MTMPTIRYYARMEYCKYNGKTPKFVITGQAGYYPPMEELKGRDGRVSMYLLPSKDSGSKKDNAPAMRLQAKDSLNFTGLKEYFENGRLSGFAYGYPDDRETYGKKKKRNPFIEYKGDGFLFIVHQDGTAATEKERITPCCIELVVLAGCKVVISAYCKQLKMGGFDEALAALRKQATGEDAL